LLLTPLPEEPWLGREGFVLPICRLAFVALSTRPGSLWSALVSLTLGEICGWYGSLLMAPLPDEPLLARLVVEPVGDVRAGSCHPIPDELSGKAGVGTTDLQT
jgi:hypothetical protein